MEVALNMIGKTAADERTEEAKELIKQAYKRLTEALDDDIWGAKYYEDSYIETLEEVIYSLRKMARKL